MGKYFDLIKEQIQQHRAELESAMQNIDKIDFKRVSEAQLDDFLRGKQVMRVEPINYPVTCGFIIWLDCCGTGLYAASIEYDEDDPQAIVHAQIATISEG